MTRILFSRGEDGQIASVDLRGHAGFADEGEDIICAAITSAIQLTHVMLEDIQKLVFDTEVEQEGTHIRLSFPTEAREEAQPMLEALRVHYNELQENYAEFIQVMEVHSHAEN